QADGWTRHATAVLGSTPRCAPAGVEGTQPPPAAAPVDLTDTYQRLAEHGYGYGPFFQGLHAAWQHNDTIYARVSLPPPPPPAATPTPPPRPPASPPRLRPPPPPPPPLPHPPDEDPPPHPRLPFPWSGVSLHATDAPPLHARLTPAGPGAITLTATDP